MRFSAAFLVLALSLPAFADAVLMKNGERYIGEVTDLGNSLRIKNAAHPDGLEVKKSDVRTVYPKPEAMLEKLRAEIAKARARYDSGRKAADPNADMKVALDLLFDPEIEAEDAIQIYPEHKKEFVELQTSIHELRKLCRDAQVSGKPAPEPEPHKPAPAPDPKSGDAPAGADKGAPPPRPADPDVLLLAPPQEAKPADIAKAAKAMQARATDHGYEGVTAKVVRRGDFSVIEMSCKEGLSPDMRKRLLWYAGRLSKKFEVRFGHAPSRGESEQFPTPSLEQVDAGKAKAPKGMKWYRYGEDQVCLLWDKHVIVWKDLGKQQVNQDGIVYFEIVNKALAATLHADESIRDGNVVAGTYFVGDRGCWGAQNTRFMFSGGQSKRVWLETGFAEADWKIAQTMLDHPLPFEMTEAK